MYEGLLCLHWPLPAQACEVGNRGADERGAQSVVVRGSIRISVCHIPPVMQEVDIRCGRRRVNSMPTGIGASMVDTSRRFWYSTGVV